jgi:3-oxoacyl-[acyl-carrier-protein] synthase-3
MATSTIHHVCIVGVAGAIPEETRSNAAIGGQSEEDYVKRLSSQVGVSSRRIVREGQLGSDLARTAVTSLLTTLQWDPKTIDLLVVATQTPDRLFPGISFLLHRSLDLPKHVPVFDINLGCSAFTHGIWVVAGLLKGVGTRAILVNVDVMSRTIGTADYGNQVLFGDAATATALQINETTASISFSLASDGRGADAVCLPNSGMSATTVSSPEFFINGPAVLALGLRTVPNVVNELFETAKMTSQDVTLFVPHQANKFILEKLVQKLDIPSTRMLVEMENFGNTSSASIPLALCSDPANTLRYGRDRTLLVGFGTGFSVSAAIADLSATTFVKPVTVS